MNIRPRLKQRILNDFGRDLLFQQNFKINDTVHYVGYPCKDQTRTRQRLKTLTDTLTCIDQAYVLKS